MFLKTAQRRVQAFRYTLVLLLAIEVPWANSQTIRCPGEMATRLRDGAIIELTLNETISSKTSHAGEQLSLSVDQDLTLNGILLVRRGGGVRAEIVDAKKAGYFGKAGTLSMRVLGITAVDGQRISVRAKRDREGESKVTTTVVLTVLFGPLGLLKRGKDASIPAGTKVTVFVDGDIEVLGCPVQQFPSLDSAGSQGYVQPPAAPNVRRPDNGSEEDVIAQYKRGLDAYHGNGTRRDNAEALELFRRAADQGNADAMQMLGTMYANGEGVGTDFVEAYKWISIAVALAPTEHRTSAKAAFARVGKMSPDRMADGERLAADWLQAFKQRGALRPSPGPGQQGVEFSQSTPRALPPRRDAAAQGDADAMFDLAVAYYQGEGVLEDYIEAHKWANLAAVRFPAEDRPKAVQLRNTVALKMTADQVLTAQKLAREWMEAFEKGKK